MNGPPFGVAQADFDHCALALRDADRHTWLATLLMADDLRTASTVLWALHTEIAAVPSRVNEPMAGEIRLQWWSDALSGERAEEANANPLARAVLALMAFANLPATPLVDHVQARVADLYGDSIGDRHAFEAYAGETKSAIYQLVCVAVLGADAKSCAGASGHAGVVDALTDVIADVAGVGVSKRTRAPSDLLAACGFDDATFTASAVDDRGSVLAALGAYGEDHLASYRAAMADVPTAAANAFLPLADAETMLANAAAKPERLRRPPSVVGQQWRLWRAMHRGFA